MIIVKFPVFPDRNFTVDADTLERVDFSHAALHRADLSHQVLCWANLSYSDLNGADLSHTDLSWANLDNAILFNTVFHSACLHGATLINARITSVLIGVDLRYAVLKDAHISLGTDFSGALLHGADMRSYGIQHSVLTGARYNKKTRWPLLFDPRSKGAIIEKTI